MPLITFSLVNLNAKTQRCKELHEWLLRRFIHICSLRLCSFASIFYWIIFLKLTSFSLAMADPWGKDADLLSSCVVNSSANKSIQTPFLGPVAEALIHFHQGTISPADGPRSHYIPSSSQYTLDAMRKYGFYIGFLMGCDRLMRENSEKWVYRTIEDANGQTMKYDPVP